jgi:hypothetical protein
MFVTETLGWGVRYVSHFLVQSHTTSNQDGYLHGRKQTRVRVNGLAIFIQNLTNKQFTPVLLAIC